METSASTSSDMVKKSPCLNFQLDMEKQVQLLQNMQYSVAACPSVVSVNSNTSESSSSLTTMSSSSPSSSVLPTVLSTSTSSVSTLGSENVQSNTPDTNTAPNSTGSFKSPSEQFLSQIPLMNSMVRCQLQRLLRARSAIPKNSPQDIEMRKLPVAVLTAYRVKIVRKNELFDYTSETAVTNPIPTVPGKVFYDNFLPIVCETLAAIIHLDKFYCPGTNRLCVEFEGSLISPLDLLKLAGPKFTSNWKGSFILGDGKCVRLAFKEDRLDFKNHDDFCTGGCEMQIIGYLQSYRKILNDVADVNMGDVAMYKRN